LKGLDRVVEKLALGIGRTQIEVVHRKLGMQGKPRRLKVRSRGLCLFPRLLEAEKLMICGGSVPGGRVRGMNCDAAVT
jgi:hypothetical protein